MTTTTSHETNNNIKDKKRKLETVNLNALTNWNAPDEAKNAKEATDATEAKEAKDAKDATEAKESKEAKEATTTKAIKKQTTLDDFFGCIRSRNNEQKKDVKRDPQDKKKKKDEKEGNEGKKKKKKDEKKKDQKKMIHLLIKNREDQKNLLKRVICLLKANDELLQDELPSHPKKKAKVSENDRAELWELSFELWKLSQFDETEGEEPNEDETLEKIFDEAEVEPKCEEAAVEEPAVEDPAGPMEVKSLIDWGCSKCRWAMRGCGVCRYWASTGDRNYSVDPNGYIGRQAMHPRYVDP